MVMSNRTLSVIILAAGKGNRMLSDLPKALHSLAGKTMVQHVIDTAAQLKATHIHLVYGYGGELLRERINHQGANLNWILQTEQCGTGHAVMQTLKDLNDDEDVLILYGDVPLVSLETLRKTITARPDKGISLVTVILDNPNDYGRIIRINGAVVGIVEYSDASEQQRQIKEINTGILATEGANLKRWLKCLNNCNAQKELYITDIIGIASNEGCKISTVQPVRNSEIEGVNNRLHLARLERIFQKEQAERLLLAGLMLSDPDRFDLRGELIHGQDVFIDTNVILEGKVTLGNKVIIGTGCILKNVIIGDAVVINPYTIIEDACIAARSILGPFTRIRPGSKLDEETHVGNFVEVKQSSLGKGTKVGHLSYIGDANIGEQVNIGAGTITCNYDGANKHKTIIGNNVFIGSDSQLVAPVSIGQGATIGAGTTVTSDVSDGEVVISRIHQFPIIGGIRPIKNINKNA